jgi:SnoaL-like polyketide cyclase
MSRETNIAAQEQLAENVHAGDILDVTADDEHVSIAYALTGTHQGDFHGVAPTDRQIEVRPVQIGRFEAGSRVERSGASDQLGSLEQIGASPAGG